MIRRFFYSIVVLFCIGFIRCTIGPTAGTETGNPDITACLTTALSMFDSVDAWLPSTYLVEGEKQLDPGNVYTRSPNVLLAKRRAVFAANSSDTVDSGSRTVRIDTIVVIDTVIIRDTIVVDTIVQDTATMRLDDDSSDAFIITQRVRYDSIFVVDTVLQRDTFYLYQTGTDMPATTGVSGREYSVDSIAKSESISADYLIIRDSISGSISLFEVPINQKDAATQRVNLDATIHTDSAFIMVARQLTISDVFVSEVYRDADGDGFLATAASGAVPLSTGIIVCRRGTGETVFQVDFDAGSDRLFGTTGDNRIRSLQRTSSEGGAVVDRIRYGPLFFGQHGDTVFLERSRMVTDDSLSQRSERFICITGDDPYDHRTNRLAVYSLTAGYGSGIIKKMDITVIPAVPLSAGQSPAAGTLRASIDFGKGLTGIIEASIDYGTATITGSYAEAGTEYHLTYKRNGNVLELHPLQQLE